MVRLIAGAWSAACKLSLDAYIDLLILSNGNSKKGIKTMDTNETLGAIRAAEIITQRPYDATGRDQRRFNTEYGTKTVKGIAAIIDRETGAPELLAELEELVFQYEALQQLDGHTKSGIAMSTKAARAAINKAKG